MARRRRLLGVAVLLAAGPVAASPTTVRVATDLTRPLFVTAPPGETERLFIVEKNGLIKILRGGTVLARPFLDLRSIVDDTGGEQGLLGLEFDPDYASNGEFYVYFTWDPGPGDDLSRLRRYTVSADPDSADVSSGFEIMRVAQPFTNHNGGTIQFGPDGYLYWGLGDGGGFFDPDDRGQDPLDLLGKMLRIDPYNDDFPSDPDQNYAVPATNPFVDSLGVRDEIWALGLRNPYRWSFDRANGDLYIADVGQDAWEEINWQSAASPGGENYGWRCYEGNAPFNTTGCGPIGDYTFPVRAYSHGTDGFSCSVTGGYVYRGAAIPSWVGTYLYADFCSDQIYSFEIVGGMLQNLQNRTTELTPGGGLVLAEISSFGEDGVGEMYIVDHGRNNPPGEVYKIVPDPTDVATRLGPRVQLGPAFPNPVMERMRLELRLRRGARVRVRVYDVMGRMVRPLLDGMVPEGSTSIAWDARDARARAVPAGLYFVRLLDADGVVTATRKVVVVR